MANPDVMDIEEICQDIPDNEVVSRFSIDGDLMLEGYCLNHKKHGTWHIWSENGEMNVMFFDQDKVYDAQRANRKKNFIMEGRDTDCYGEPNAKIKTYYANKNIKSQLRCENGFAIGRIEYFHENGNKSVVMMSNEKGFYDGEYIIWGEDGILRANGGFKNGKRHGKWIRYYDNGALKSEENFNEGPMQGVQIYYLPSGKILERCYFEDNDPKSCDVGGDQYDFNE
jgi:antitoxin component YwqK of YwqJK toxin-antitoxin module